MSDKYPRTFHAPLSPGCTSDDKRAEDISGLLGEQVVITEKIDGSNVCFTSEAVFARSHNGPPTHRSFDLAKQIHSTVKGEIPPGISVFGEYAYALHSIPYTKLPGYFMIFGVRDDTKGFWFSWWGVQEMAKTLNLPTVPVLLYGRFDSEKHLNGWIKSEMSTESKVGSPEKEGLVVRVTDAFSDEEFSARVAKYVRANHVTSSEHWAHQTITQNGLAK